MEVKRVQFFKECKKPLTYVVIVARYQDKFVFCRHKNRTTFELPGGHIEKGETALEASRRELMEETGAIDFNIELVGYYQYDFYGVIFYAEIKKLGILEYEIEELIFEDTMPVYLTYPMIQPKIFHYAINNIYIPFSSNFKRMIAGVLYDASKNDPSYHQNAVRLCKEYNQTEPDEIRKRKEIIKRLFGSTKEHFYLEPSIKTDYGFNIHIGNYFYSNFDCVFLDVAPIVFGDNVFIAPRCCFYTAGHPIASSVRNEDLEYGYPIRVGSNVWFGGSVVVNPGVTIGDNVVIGSGSVVTKDIPSNVVACGNPCRVIRSITEEDERLWQKQRDFLKKNNVD